MTKKRNCVGFAFSYNCVFFAFFTKTNDSTSPTPSAITQPERVGIDVKIELIASPASLEVEIYMVGIEPTINPTIAR